MVIPQMSIICFELQLQLTLLNEQYEVELERKCIDSPFINVESSYTFQHLNP